MPDRSHEWLPAQGRPAQMMVLLHDHDQSPTDMLPLAQRLQHVFPQAALLVPAGLVRPGAVTPVAGAPHEAGAGADPAAGVATDHSADHAVERTSQAAAGLAADIDALARWVRQAQGRLGALPQETAVAGFGHGGTLAIELAYAHDGLAGRVLAFGALAVSWPAQAPQLTTLHLLHGGQDDRFPAAGARRTLQHLGMLQGDCTLDIAQEIGHDLHPALVDCAIHRLTHHIPQRTWRAALGAAPPAPPPGPGDCIH